MTLELAHFRDDPKKISTKSSYPQKIFIFLKTPKNIEIQNFEPKKIARAYVCVKISEYPLGLRMPVVDKVDMYTYAKFDQNIHCGSDVIIFSLTANGRTDGRTDSHSDYSVHMLVVQFLKK